MLYEFHSERMLEYNSQRKISKRTIEIKRAWHVTAT